MSGISLPRISRRVALGGLAAVGMVAAAIAAKTGALRSTSLHRAISGGRSRSIALPTAEMEDWMAAVGAEFDIAYTRMRLTGVRALESEGDRPEGLRRRGFVAVFTLPQGEALPGDLIYRIAHRQYGAFDIYLAPPSDDALNRMQAVFN